MASQNNAALIADEMNYLLLSIEALDRKVLNALALLLSKIEEVCSALGGAHEAAASSALSSCREKLIALQSQEILSLESGLWSAFVSAATELSTILASEAWTSEEGMAARPVVTCDAAGDAARADYLAARHILLPELESEILGISEGEAESVQAVRRELHTIKGDAGFLGFTAIESACHRAEDWLDAPNHVDLQIDRLLKMKDWLGSALDALAIDAAVEPLPDDLFVSPAVVEPVPLASPPTSMSDCEADEHLGAQAESADWDEDTLELLEEFLQESADGLSIADEILLASQDSGISLDNINALFRTFHSMKGVSSFLELDQITTLSHATETLLGLARSEEFDFSGSNLNFLFDSTSETRSLLDDLQGAIEGGRAPQYRQSAQALTMSLRAAAESKAPLPNPATSPVAAVPAPAVAVPASAAAAPSAAVSSPKSAVAASPPESVPAQVAKSASSSKFKRIKETVKIDLERVDSLVELIGELVIVESMVVNEPLISGLSSPKVDNYLSQLGKIARDLQDISMRMRMVPVRTVFQKMSRLVRDLSVKENKKIRATLNGEWNEMDRSMVEQLADPLVHMIRNAVDHGLESEPERVAAGKSPEGNITLSAYHQGGSIVIEVSDDGRGLNREALLSKAAERGIIKSGEILSDFEVYNLIFAPGFSTAKAVTQISGRGVGMDVVRRNVEAIRGRVSISSRPGKGSTFKMILPLTLAIIDGMVITTGRERYIIPTLSIIESVRPEPSVLYTYADGGAIMKIREESIPLVRLDALFEIQGAEPNPSFCQVVILETTTGKIGLVVDEVVAQQQVVIKPLGSGVPDTRFLSGAAILSDGRVGLILNVDELSAMARDMKGSMRAPSKGRSSTPANIPPPLDTPARTQETEVQL